MFGWLSEPATRDSRRKRCANDGVGRVERAQLLERDEAVQVGLAREVDHRHAAASELAQDLVTADGLHDVRHQGPSLLAPSTSCRDSTARVNALSLHGGGRSIAAARRHGNLSGTDADVGQGRAAVEAVRPGPPYDLPARPGGLPRAARRRRGRRRRRVGSRGVGVPALFEADLVVLDHAMPGGSGLHRRGARVDRRARDRVHAPTAPQDTVLAAMQAGAIGFLRKDTLTMEGLAAAVQAAASGAGVVTPELLGELVRSAAERPTGRTAAPIDANADRPRAAGAVADRRRPSDAGGRPAALLLRAHRQERPARRRHQAQRPQPLAGRRVRRPRRPDLGADPNTRQMSLAYAGRDAARRMSAR